MDEIKKLSLELAIQASIYGPTGKDSLVALAEDFETYLKS